jgi:hypothetical protein
MDVIIKPFWIVLSLVYFCLAAIHYKMRFRVTPSTYISAAHTPAPDNNPFTPVIFRQFLRDLEQNQKLLRYASYGFFVAGVVSLSQGILNLDSEIPVNVVFVLLAAIIVFFIIYWRERWIIWVFYSPIRGAWYKRKYRLQSTKQKSLWDRIKGR